MINSICNKVPLQLRMPGTDTTGVLASRSTNIFASVAVSASPNIFGGSSGSTETSGSCASSSGGGGSTIAVA